MPHSHKQKRTPKVPKGPNVLEPRISLASHDHSESDTELGIRNLRSPSPDIPVRSRPEKLRPSDGDEQQYPAKNRKKYSQAQDLSPLSKWREEFSYMPNMPKTPHNRKQSREVHNLVSSEESEGELPTPPVSILRRPKDTALVGQRSKHYNQNTLLLPPPKPNLSTNHRHAAQVNCEEDLESINEPSPQVHPKVKRKCKSSKTKKVVMEEDVESADELAPPPSQVVKRKITKGRKKNSAVLELLEELKKTQLALSAFSDSGELEGQDAATIQQLREQCFIVDKILNPPAEVNGAEVPSTIDHYDQLFMYLAKSNLVYLVQPVHVFAGNRYYKRNKTFGLVRVDKNSEPLMCTISGAKNCADLHPKLLDAELWTEEVIHWAKEHGHTFRNGMYDELHGKTPGHYHAAHVEPRLMLWFACYMVNQRLGLNKPEREQIAHIWRLNKFKDITAEIMISHSNKKACGSCMAFQKDIEEYTGIKYSIISCPNLGELQMVRSKYRKNEVPLYAVDSEQEGDEEEVESAVPTPTLKQIEVVVRSKTTTTTSSSVVSRRAPKANVSQAPFQRIAVQKAQEMKKAKKTSTKSKKRSHQARVDDEDDEDDDTPFVVSSREQKKHKYR